MLLVANLDGVLNGAVAVRSAQVPPVEDILFTAGVDVKGIPRDGDIGAVGNGLLDLGCKGPDRSEAWRRLLYKTAVRVCGDHRRVVGDATRLPRDKHHCSRAACADFDAG